MIRMMGTSLGNPRVLLADDHRLLLDAFERLLEPTFEIVAKVADGRELLKTAEALRPDVVVLDISMPKLNGLDAGRRLRELLPEVKLVFLTVNDDPDTVAEAMRIGASAYLLKGSAASELFRAIQEAVLGGTYLTPKVRTPHAIGVDRSSSNGAKGAGLTYRQREVLQLLAEGHSMKQVAQMLEVTARTVAFHKYGIMKAHQLKSNAELFRYALKEGLVSV